MGYGARPMTDRLPFPRARHLALAEAATVAEAGRLAKESAAEAVAVPLEATGVPGLPLALSVDVASPEEESCLSLEGKACGVACASSGAARDRWARLAAEAARRGDALLLAGLDRWWRLGPDGAGYCKSCGAALVERLREVYGEHVMAFDALGPLRSPAPVRERPYGGLREALRLSEAVEACKQAALRARDEARRARQTEMPVLGRTGALSPLSLLLCRHLDGLVFDLPSADPLECLVPLLAARAALGQRPAVAMAPAGATEAQVRLLSALATACDCDLALPEGAGQPERAALAAHRRYLAAMSERLRPAAPLADLTLLVSPAADAWSGGAHFRALGLAAAALARLHLQLGVALDLRAAPRAPMVIAGCGGLREEEALAARRHVTEGGDLLLVGRCALLDDEGRAVEPVFAGARAGLNRIGEGRAWAVAPEEDAPRDAEAQIGRAARELLGRGRASLTLTGRGSLLLRAYLDPERKLDVHVVNLDAAPAQGMTLHVAGQVAGGGRSGFWFAPDREKGTEGERIALNPAGFGVSTVLPRLGGSALLTVPR